MVVVIIVFISKHDGIHGIAIPERMATKSTCSKAIPVCGVTKNANMMTAGKEHTSPRLGVLLVTNITGIVVVLIVHRQS